MGKCPYTWFKSLIGGTKKANGEASMLRVTVLKNAETTVDVMLPARNARWLIDLIPDEVVQKIKAEGIPLESIQANLANAPLLYPQSIFSLEESTRTVKVWLE